MVGIHVEAWLAIVAALHDVLGNVGEIDAEGARHGDGLPGDARRLTGDAELGLFGRGKPLLSGKVDFDPGFRFVHSNRNACFLSPLPAT